MVREESPGIRERGSALLDGGNDGCEIVIQQHKIRGLACHIRPGETHGDANVCFVEGRSIVNAVAGHGDYMSALAQRTGNRQLFLR